MHRAVLAQDVRVPLRAPSRATRAAGFSLVEVLVTLSITALASVLIIATARPQDALRAEAEQLSEAMQRLDRRARISGIPTGLIFEPAAYSGATWQGGAWMPLPGTRRRLTAGVTLRADTGTDNTPQIVFDPLGHPFAGPVSLRKDGREIVLDPPGAEATR